MPATLRSLVDHDAFGVTERSAHDESAAVIGWVHSSDLEDPSPFLSPGQMLLTTGRQFPDNDSELYYSDYVERLVRAGVVALGFGTEVIRAGTPAALEAACRSADLPLVEVPYRTPFIAISQWVAGVQAAEARSRVDWALATQNAVSVAALGAGGVRAAIQKTADHLACEIALFDADAELTDAAAASGIGHSTVPDEVVAHLGRLLGAQHRSRSDRVVAGEFVTVQTLGSTGSLTGALVLSRAEPFDSADFSVVTTLVALAEVSLEHRQSLRVSLRALMEQLFLLLRDGRVVEVRRAIEAIAAGMPGERLRVVEVRLDLSRPALRDALERRASEPHNRLFITGGPTRLTLLIEPSYWPDLAAFIRRRGGSAGVSDAIGWQSLAIGVVQARRALERTNPGEATQFSELVSASFLGLLASSSVAEIADARLSVLRASAHGSALLTDAVVWLGHNAAWDPAARELHIHRHSLKARMAELGQLVGLDLERFQDRAELWALLSSLNLYDV
ncbi:PucR family transcriptional regulator [Subtercola sp. RTI3]|uniref:PucR family transcriptional regulator n=1 Tax=Subtercola sp. RTI3 TaxID=3048639 RepID=UPI002B223D15|nr:PucR family transcriptional regulator [Subtercola sp. RTI3]MEA9984858.1 PucR family transcriptional regulator [Subtercola sp. RTI3]